MKFYFSTPLERFEKELGLVAGKGFYPEVRMVNPDVLFRLSDSDIGRIRDELDKRGLVIFSHGPFFGLDIAGMDRRISEYSRDCLIRGIEVTSSLGGKIMVMHTGYLPYFSRGGKKQWFRNWGERMKPVLGEAEKAGVQIVLENTWDDKPEILLHLSNLVSASGVGFCLDTGHVNCFSKVSFRTWWENIGERVEVLHLHDNDGHSDEHLPAGQGIFDFRELAVKLKERDFLPLLDLEVDLAGAEESRSYLEKIFREEGLK